IRSCAADRSVIQQNSKLRPSATSISQRRPSNISASVARRTLTNVSVKMKALKIYPARFFSVFSGAQSPSGQRYLRVVGFTVFCLLAMPGVGLAQREYTVVKPRE